jgi:uncharacterized membrane protein
MTKINRDDIHIISQHSNWHENAVAESLEKNVYNNASKWHQFLRLFFITLGVGFAISGIIFFFAYNWNNLHKFVKLGMAEGLVIVATLVVLFSKADQKIKNIVLTGAAFLVGVLFAVFGQIYQTGANAYDFFLGWTIFIALWAFVSNFAPLWLLFLILVNTTIVLYGEQVAYHWSYNFVQSLLIIINSGALFLFLSLKNKIDVPKWFTNTISLAIVISATFGILDVIFDGYNQTFPIIIPIVLALYAFGIYYIFKHKSGFYLAIIAFSLIIIISALFIKLSDDVGMFFFISLFVIASTTLVIKKLIDFQKNG